MSVRFMSCLSRALLAAGLMWLVTSGARACDAVLVAGSSTMQLEYDPFAFARTVGRLTFTIENHESDACDVDIVLLDATRTSVDEATVGDTGVRVVFSAGAGEAALVPTATPGVWRVKVEPGRTALTIEGVVRQDAVATAGEHSVDLNLEVRDVGTLATHVAALPVRVLLDAVPRAQMNIVGAAGTFGEGTPISQIDFGVLESDARRRVFLQVRANSSARLTIDSANQGRLLREDSPEQEKGIPYAAQLVDEPIDLTRHWERVIDPPRSIAGTSMPLDLIIGAVGAHAAGTYSDMLTIKISAL